MNDEYLAEENRTHNNKRTSSSGSLKQSKLRIQNQATGIEADVTEAYRTGHR